MNRMARRKRAFLRLLCLFAAAAAIEKSPGRKMAQNTQMELSGRKRGRNIKPLRIAESTSVVVTSAMSW
jgi:hypothetical protein